MIAIHIEVPGSQPIDIQILPAAPISLLKRKIGRAIGLPASEISLWTARSDGDQGEREKIAKVEEGYEVSWWVNHDDWLIVE